MSEIIERRVQKFMDDLFAVVARAHKLQSGDVSPGDQLAIDQCTRTLALVLDRYIKNNGGTRADQA